MTQHVRASEAAQTARRNADKNNNNNNTRVCFSSRFFFFFFKYTSRSDLCSFYALVVIFPANEITYNYVPIHTYIIILYIIGTWTTLCWTLRNPRLCRKLRLYCTRPSNCSYTGTPDTKTIRRTPNSDPVGTYKH